MRVLSVDGGGYLGLATASFAQGIESHFDKRFSDEFDLFCGTSTGAIIALAFAIGKTGEEIVELYKALGQDVFGGWSKPRAACRTMRSIFTAKYSDKGLKKALNDTFGNQTLSDLTKRGKKALITSFCLSTGQPRIFKTNHSKNLTLHGEYRLQDIALASAAAPTFFPVVELTNPKNQVTESFCDGGVVANHPGALGFAEAVSELGVPAKDVRLLSLSTPRTNLAEANIKTRGTTRGVWTWKGQLVSVLIDSNSMISDQCLSRILKAFGPQGPRYERINLRNEHNLPMDRADKHATDLLVRVGTQEASSNITRTRIEDFFIEPAGTENVNGRHPETIRAVS